MDVAQKRLANLRQAIGKRTVTAFCREYGIDKSYVSHLFNGRRVFGERAARKIEGLMGIPENTLDQEPLITQSEPRSLRPAGAVPLVPWERVLAPASRRDETDDWLRCPLVNVSHNTFALKVPDASMESTTGRSLLRNTIVFIDPDAAKSAKAGDIVLAHINKQARLRELTPDGRKQALRPFNTQYALEAESFHIVGVAIGSWVPFRG